MLVYMCATLRLTWDSDSTSFFTFPPFHDNATSWYQSCLASARLSLHLILTAGHSDFFFSCAALDLWPKSSGFFSYEVLYMHTWSSHDESCWFSSSLWSHFSLIQRNMPVPSFYKTPFNIWPETTDGKRTFTVIFLFRNKHLGRYIQLISTIL